MTFCAVQEVFVVVHETVHGILHHVSRHLTQPNNLLNHQFAGNNRFPEKPIIKVLRRVYGGFVNLFIRHNPGNKS